MSILADKNSKVITVGVLCSVVTGIVAIPTVAAAQDGALWRDDRGRQMTLDFSGGNSPPPFPASRSPEQMASMFAQVCLTTSGEPSAVKAAISALQLTDKSYDMPVAKNQPPWPLVIARGDGVVVSQAEKFLSNPRRQCNVIFYLPEASDLAPIEAALASQIGRPADNAAERVKKNGKPNKYFSPEWLVAGQTGANNTVSVSQLASFGPSSNAGVQFSLLAKPESRK